MDDEAYHEWQVELLSAVLLTAFTIMAVFRVAYAIDLARTAVIHRMELREQCGMVFEVAAWGNVAANAAIGAALVATDDPSLNVYRFGMNLLCTTTLAGLMLHNSFSIQRVLRKHLEESRWNGGDREFKDGEVGAGGSAGEPDAPGRGSTSSRKSATGRRSAGTSVSDRIAVNVSFAMRQVTRSAWVIAVASGLVIILFAVFIYQALVEKETSNDRIFESRRGKYRPWNDFGRWVAVVSNAAIVYWSYTPMSGDSRIRTPRRDYENHKRATRRLGRVTTGRIRQTQLAGGLPVRPGDSGSPCRRSNESGGACSSDMTEGPSSTEERVSVRFV